MNIRSVTYALLSLLFATSTAHAAPDQAKLLRISPSGADVQSTRQIVFQFDKPVAPLGDMARASTDIPVTFSPNLSCEWRWISPTTLGCQLSDQNALKLATEYTLSVQDNASTEEAKTIQTSVRAYLSNSSNVLGSKSLFITERPKVTTTFFSQWRGPGSPRIVVYTNQAVSAEQIASHLVFVGENTKTESKVVSLNDSTPIPTESTYWYIEPTKELPLKSTISLKVTPGLTAIAGGAPGIEDREILSFETHDTFRFLGVRCCATKPGVPTSTPISPSYEDFSCRFGSSVFIATNEAPSEEKRCDPQSKTAMVFSSPVATKDIAAGISSTPSFKEGLQQDQDPWSVVFDSQGIYQPYKKGAEYWLNLPGGLKPYTTYTLSGDKTKLQDIFGRNLENSIAQSFLTDNRLPRMVLDETFSTLEKDVSTHLPVAVQNVDSLNLTYVTNQNVTEAKKVIPVDRVENLSYYFPLKIRELLSGSGLLFGTLSSNPPSASTDPAKIFSQVTPFHVMAKIGHFNSLVWVNTFATGASVEGAEISIFPGHLSELDLNLVTPLAVGTTDKNGIALLKGTDEIDPEHTFVQYENAEKPFLKVLVKKDTDIALVPALYSYEVSPYTASGDYIETSSKERFGHLRVWGTTPQGVYKLGEPIQYKIYVRNQNVNTLIPAPKEGYSLEIIDPMGKLAFKEPKITLNEFGSFAGQFTTPPSGAVGHYRFKLTALFAPRSSANYSGEEDSEGVSSDSTSIKKEGKTIEAMKVLVSDFTPSPFKVTTDIHSNLAHLNEPLTVSTEAKLHAGGPYGKAPSHVNARVIAQTIAPADPAFAQYTFLSAEPTSDFSQETVFDSDSSLNDLGRAESTFSVSNQKLYYGSLAVESSVKDDRGKSIASTATVPFAGRDRFVGAKLDNWTYKIGVPVAAHIVVITDEGKVSPNTQVSVQIQRKETKATRVKGAGNAYLTSYNSEQVDVATCTITSSPSIWKSAL